jgi:hypothetical protein
MARELSPARTSKWDFGIDLETCSDEDIQEYATTKLYEYQDNNNYTDDNLWYLFQEDFKDFLLENWAAIPRTVQLNLRKCLRCRGVVVPPNGKSTTMAQALKSVATEDEQGKWTEQEMAAACTDLLNGPIVSKTLIKLWTQQQGTGTQEPKNGNSNIGYPSTNPLGMSSNLPAGSSSPMNAHSPTPRSVRGVSTAGFTSSNEPVSITANFPGTGGFTGIELTPESPQRTHTNEQPQVQTRMYEQPKTQHQHQTQPQPGNSKQVADVAKIYTDDQKYDGTNGSLDHKLTIFWDICERVELPEHAQMKAFPAMLKGLAQDHFYSNRLSKRTMSEACNHLRNFFEGPGFHRRNLDEWNSISLTSITAQNPANGTYQNVQMLINKLRVLQYGLATAFRTTDFLHNKIITACQGSPACRYAVSDPPADLGQLIHKLQSSITSYEKEQEASPDTFFTDRRYHRLSDRRRQDRYGGRSRPTSGRRGICFICKKEGCRTWKHSQQEQEDEKARYQNRAQQRFGPGLADSKFNKAFHQYVAEYEGDSDSDEFGDALAALLEENPPDDQDPHHQESFFTACGTLSATAAASTVEQLSNQAFLHSLSPGITRNSELLEMATSEVAASEVGASPYDSAYASEPSPRYGSDQFQGILIDTGAAKHSTAGLPQFQALQRTSPTPLDKSSAGAVTVRFGIGTSSSVGSAVIQTPIGSVEFHVMPAATPFLLSLSDMDKLGIYLNNLTNTLVTPQGNLPVVRQYGHPFLLWDTSLQSFLTETYECFLTTTELHRLHRRFGHPSVPRLQRVLERAGQEVDKEALEYLTRYCDHCQRYGRSPGRFQFNLREDVNFNCSIIVDVFYIQSQPVLHVVDEATRYQAGRWLTNISARTTWDTLRMCWIDTYLGPPDQLTTDAGKNFASREFRQLARDMGTKVKIVPVEAHNSVGIVERYHPLIRRAYQIITAELPEIGKEMALQMAVKTINDTAGPNGLIPTLLVYGAFPRMSELDGPAASVTQRAAAIRKATAEITKLRAKRQVSDALGTRNGPNVSVLHSLPLNSPVLVWREGNTGQTGSWEGPYPLVSITNEDCVLALPRGNTTFRSTVVKPYYSEQPSEGTQPSEQRQPSERLSLAQLSVQLQPQPEVPDDTIVVQTGNQEQGPVKRGRGRPRKQPLASPAHITIFLQEDQYQASRQQEVSGLLEKGVFEVAARASIPPGTRIFKARFVDEVKHKGTDKAFEKSRLVVQAYNDQEKDLVLTQSPTIQRVSQRIMLGITPMLLASGSGITLNIRDISQAYVQSTTTLNRDFYVQPPAELTEHMGIPSDSILQVVKPLYGVPEAGNHWFRTYHSHHVQELGMEQSTYDPCLLYSTDPFGVIGMQTDDTLILGSSEFVQKEQDKLKKAGFLAKEREQLLPGTKLKFNGGTVQLESNGSLSLTQEHQCKNLKLVISEPVDSTSSRGATRKGLTSKEQYIAQRARGAYIASVCQPEASYDLSVAAQATDITSTDVSKLNKRLQWQLESGSRGLRFVNLDKNTLRLLVFTDASFANNKDLSSQIGYVLALADENNNANVLHWSSIKCKRVTRSVLASELYGMAHGFDIGAAVKATIERILEIELPLVICTDSRSLYDCLVKLGTTQEKRLMVDVMCLRQAYERREIAEVKWVAGASNPADSMTKGKPSGALKQLIDTNKVQLEEKEWVERTE